MPWPYPARNCLPGIYTVQRHHWSCALHPKILPLCAKPMTWIHHGDLALFSKLLRTYFNHHIFLPSCQLDQKKVGIMLSAASLIDNYAPRCRFLPSFSSKLGVWSDIAVPRYKFPLYFYSPCSSYSCTVIDSSYPVLVEANRKLYLQSPFVVFSHIKIFQNQVGLNNEYHNFQ